MPHVVPRMGKSNQLISEGWRPGREGCGPWYRSTAERRRGSGLPGAAQDCSLKERRWKVRHTKKGSMSKKTDMLMTLTRPRHKHRLITNVPHRGTMKRNWIQIALKQSSDPPGPRPRSELFFHPDCWILHSPASEFSWSPGAGGAITLQSGSQLKSSGESRKHPTAGANSPLQASKQRIKRCQRALCCLRCCLWEFCFLWTERKLSELKKSWRYWKVSSYWKRKTLKELVQHLEIFVQALSYFTINFWFL